MMRNTDNGKLTLRIVAALTLSALFAAGAQAAGRDAKTMQAEQYEALLTANFRGKSPEYIAKYFVQPNGFCAQYAMKAMVAEHGRKAIGLMTKLLKDENPIMRYSAVKVLGDILLPEPTKPARPKKRGAVEAKTLSQDTEQFIQLVEPIADDKNPAVQQAIGETFSRIAVDSPQLRRIALKMADNADLSVRNIALEFGRRIIKDPNTCVRIGMTVSRHHNIPHMWAVAHMLIAANKDSDVSRQGLPALIDYLANVGNTLPVRGMFSDGPQKSALETLKAQWDAEVEKMPDAVAAVCCAFVRVPHNNYPGWVLCRKTALDILKKMTPAAGPAIADYVKKERAWLQKADEAQLKTLAEIGGSREQFTTAIDYLEYVGQCVAAGKPVTKECPLRLDPKDKVEVPALRLDNPDLQLQP